MQTAVLLVVAMLVTAPITGYLQATIWALEQGLMPKEALDSKPIATSLH